MPSTETVVAKANFSNYHLRLHSSAVLALFANALAVFIVTKHSTKAMGLYKYYILLTLITAVIMDLHLSVIYQPYPLFSISAMCGTGLFQNFSNFWGHSVQYVSRLNHIKPSLISFAFRIYYT